MKSADSMDPGFVRAPAWRTWANAVTLVRLLLAPLLFAAISQLDWPRALAIFVLAIATDLLDGPLARRRGEVSAFGGFLDHATDAVFVATGLAALARLDLCTPLLPLLLLAAFAQYTFDSKALEGRPLRASRLGRVNGILYFVLLGTPLVREGVGLGFPPDGGVVALGWLLVAATVASMADRALALTATR